MSGNQYDPEVGNFRIISRPVIDSLGGMREKLRFFGGMVDWLGYSTGSINVPHAKRYAGETSYTITKLVELATNIIIAYSDKPLSMAIKFGFSMSFLASTYGAYIVLRAIFYGSTVTGWSSLIASVYFIGGIIIAILGVLGIYLGKTFEQVKNRPLYVVAETTDTKEENK
jgi:hypothetical protein